MLYIAQLEIEIIERQSDYADNDFVIQNNTQIHIIEAINEDSAINKLQKVYSEKGDNYYSQYNFEIISINPII